MLPDLISSAQLLHWVKRSPQASDWQVTGFDWYFILSLTGLITLLHYDHLSLYKQLLLIVSLAPPRHH